MPQNKLITFENINDRVINLNEFALKWRFTEEDYNILPSNHLDQLKPLDKDAAKFLWDFSITTNLHIDFPFKKDLFDTIDQIRIDEGNQSDIKKWLYKRGIPFQKEVFISWQPDLAMIIPWKLLVKYYDDFYYSSSDDLSVFDSSLNWALAFFHKDEIYFGSNEKYIAINDYKIK